MGPDRLPEGLYDELVTRSLQQHLAAVRGLHPQFKAVDEADQPEVLARHVKEVVERQLRMLRSDGDRLAFLQRVLDAVGDDGAAVDAAELLQSLGHPAGPAVGLGRVRHRPVIPLSSEALLTNASSEPSVGNLIRAELSSADEVNVIMAFVKWHGIRLMEKELAELRDAEVPLRIITTTYMGATERAALDRLIEDFGAEVRVQYDTQRTRLHAKAWLYRRNTGFDTAYVGSSNLSRSALLDGVEWNVRLTAVTNPTLLEKIGATFDTYWNDPSYELYRPGVDRDRIDDALAEAAGRRAGGALAMSLSGLELRPYPFQQLMLEKLQAEREVHDRHRNLVVAATGTGKTVVAALDYRRLARQAGTRPKLLFVAHRKEILSQSLRTFREALGDANFGELYVDGLRPERWDHIFASVQSLHAYGADNIPPDAFDVVIIDEFHHAQAKTYRNLVDHLQPQEFLALTATPLRADGFDVRSLTGGRAAVEMPLWEALRADLLVPFHYFAVSDTTDLTAIEWRQGAYDSSQLSNLFTGNHARARTILQAVRDKIADLSAMKAIGFCVSVAHARYMTEAFNQAGICAATLVGTDSGEAREQTLTQLRAGTIHVIFAVDILNEGLDIPDVNTVLFLRPTESPMVFLQQLGRGLRRAPDKAVLTALDFVGHHRQEFRLDERAG